MDRNNTNLKIQVMMNKIVTDSSIIKLDRYLLKTILFTVTMTKWELKIEMER